MKRLSRLVFRNFWSTVALGGALGEWIIACWFLGPPASLAVHGLGVAALTLVNRLAAAAYDRERHTGELLHAAGGVTLAACFVAAVGAAALGVAAGGWWVLETIAALPAQAGALVPTAAARFDEPFRGLAAGAIGVAMAVAAWGYTHGHRRLHVTRLDVPLGDLPPHLDGLRIVHVSDLHLGPTAHRGALHEAFDRVNALDPDLICVTGDIVDSARTDLDHWLPELDRLRARHGVFAILGNHDREAGTDRVAAALRSHTRWHVLRDEVATVEIDGRRLHLVGLIDRKAPDTAAMLPGLLATVPAGEPRVLLVHQPVAFPAAAEAGVPLTLAGHTHGGQVAVPGFPALNPARFMMTRYDAGTFASGDSVLHVNRGLGTSGQRIRVAAPREITVVTLLAPVAAAA
jgi:predicted MPP superfamily phosphohydrolase